MIQGPLVDTHFHLFSDDMPMTGTAWHKPTADGSIEAYLREMDQNGIGFGIITAASVYGTYNDYSIKAMRRSPRLRATAFVDPTIDFYSLEKMKADGFVGVRLFFRHVPQPPDLRTPEYRRLLYRIRDLGWHVHVLANGAQLPDIIRIVEDAGVNLVLDHFGLPDPDLGINDPGFKAALAAVERGKTWVKISASYRQPSLDVAKTYAAALLRVPGGERLLYGSDWPFFGFEGKVTYPDCVKSFEAMVPDAATRLQIGADTPMRLYFSA